ncbi:MAG: vWA domain-containing protein [Chloroflexota bacterium]
MSALQAYVRDLGRGLVMVGGQGSYGAGGYARTPIEATLPVDMDVRDRDRQPDVALVVVIDESGSMDACHCNTANRDRGVAISGIPKVDIGKEAILRAASALTERDELGVVAFNEGAHWLIRTAPLGEAGDVEARIAGIRANGQTNILSGLTAAVDSLEGVQAERRHIVLLTDGWSSSGQYRRAARPDAGCRHHASGRGRGRAAHRRSSSRSPSKAAVTGQPRTPSRSRTSSCARPRWRRASESAEEPFFRCDLRLPRSGRPRRRLPRSSWATTARPSSRRHSRCWSRGGTTRSSRSGSTAWVGGGLDLRRERQVGATGWDGTASGGSSRRRSHGPSRRGERWHRGVVRRGGRRHAAAGPLHRRGRHPARPVPDHGPAHDAGARTGGGDA